MAQADNSPTSSPGEETELTRSAEKDAKEIQVNEAAAELAREWMYETGTLPRILASEPKL